MAREVTLERGDGYGFHLASENGNQFIRKIDKKSPAEHAGILDGDRLIGVSDVIVVIQSTFFLNSRGIILIYSKRCKSQKLPNKLLLIEFREFHQDF